MHSVRLLIGRRYVPVARIGRARPGVLNAKRSEDLSPFRPLDDHLTLADQLVLDHLTLNGHLTTPHAKRPRSLRGR